MPKAPTGLALDLEAKNAPTMLEPMPLGTKIMSNCELSNPTILFRKIFFFLF